MMYPFTIWDFDSARRRFSLLQFITTFKLRQSVEIIGQCPNHALSFIGIVGDELVFLDSHMIQPTTVLNADDESYHCCYASRMNFTELNPIALCFYF
ncbi:cysteine protease ATG4B-like isoform X2 [Tachypleus tridentatus]|uniref:cysteine protease ATG4B-like isoform X2 n=1 Tax=Tachypleus tridentatus TaxID=6853 RepID=UPI003FD69F51